MANHLKKPPLSETDLALAATLLAEPQWSHIDDATSGKGYDFYRSARQLYGTVLHVGMVPPPPLPTLLSTVERICPKGRRGEIAANKAVIEALTRYVQNHNVSGVPFVHAPVFLGRAGLRTFWAPYLIKIDGKKRIAYFDPRLNDELTHDARRLIFSINHTHIRQQDPAQYGDVGFVIFQFPKLRRPKGRRVIAYFDDGMEFWSDKEIGQMIDTAYSVLDEINRRRAA